jgi:glycerate kinase
MKIIIAPGAFKNSLTATKAADAIHDGLVRSGIEADFVKLPIADGGNGTLDAILATTSDGVRISTSVQDPLGREVSAEYGLIDDGKTAIIEMALASGLELLADHELNPMKTSTYGTGQLLRHALEAGARRFVVGLGGSATVDGACGALMALGMRVFDDSGQEIADLGGRVLSKVHRVDLQQMDPSWEDCEIRVAVDVENPPFGDKGAAAVFGPQKGATDADIPELEAGLRNFFSVLSIETGRDVTNLVGGGAAGGMSAGLYTALDAQLVSGSDLILGQIGFDKHLLGASLVITGEGQMDSQTVEGKGPFGVALRAGESNVPTVALVGGLSVDDAFLHDAGVAATFSIVNRPMTLDAAIDEAYELLERAALRLGYILQVQSRL